VLLLPFKYFTNSPPNSRFQSSSQGPNFMANLQGHCLCNHTMQALGSAHMAAFRRLAPSPCTHPLTFCITIPQESGAASTALGAEGPAHCSPIPCSWWPSPTRGPGCGWRTRAGEAERILFARANENGF